MLRLGARHKYPVKLAKQVSDFKDRVLLDGGDFKHRFGVRDPLKLSDDASLVITPNAIKAAKHYAVIPSDGSGDGTVSRATKGSFKNKDGLIEEAAIDETRVDWSDGFPAILCEPERTNEYNNSEDFTAIDWVTFVLGSGSLPIVTPNYAVSPKGINSATRVQFECGGVAVSDASRIYETIGLDGISKYTQSIYIKSNTGVDQDLLFFTQSTDYEPITVTNDWVKVDATFLSNTTNGRNFGLAARGDIQESVDVLIWQAQLSKGEYPTSSILTAGTTVTRLADQLTGFGDVGTFNSEEFTFFIDCKTLSLTHPTTRRIVLFKDSNNRFIFEWKPAGGLDIAMIVGGSHQYSLEPFTFDTTVYNKYAVRVKENDISFFINGAEVASTNISSVFPANTLDTLNFMRSTGVSGLFHGKIKSLKVYNRGLTNQELEYLTS